MCWAVGERGQSPPLRRKGGREARKALRGWKEPELNLGEEVAIISLLMLASCVSFVVASRTLSTPGAAFNCSFSEDVGTLGKCQHSRLKSGKATPRGSHSGEAVHQVVILPR